MPRLLLIACVLFCLPACTGASVTISTGDVSATIKGKGKKEGAQ